MTDVRDYGLGNIKVHGAPRFKTLVPSAPACPHCGCASIARIEIDVVDHRLRGGSGLGTYLSCVACPWASPMACVATAAAAAQSETP